MHETFQAFADKQAHLARQAHLVPLLATPERIDMWRKAVDERSRPLYLFPYLGGYLSPGWRRINLRPVADTRGVHMGENDGFGVYVVALPEKADNIDALTPWQFALRLTEGWGYAIVGENVDCVLIGAFKLIARSPVDPETEFMMGL